MKQYKRTINGVAEYFSEPLIADGKQIFKNSSERGILLMMKSPFLGRRTPSKRNIKHGMTIARSARHKQRKIMFNFKITEL